MNARPNMFHILRFSLKSKALQEHLLIHCSPDNLEKDHPMAAQSLFMTVLLIVLAKSAHIVGLGMHEMTSCISAQYVVMVWLGGAISWHSLALL